MEFVHRFMGVWLVKTLRSNDAFSIYTTLNKTASFTNSED